MALQSVWNDIGTSMQWPLCHYALKSDNARLIVWGYHIMLLVLPILYSLRFRSLETSEDNSSTVAKSE